MYMTRGHRTLIYYYSSDWGNNLAKILYEQMKGYIFGQQRIFQWQT